MRGTTRRKRQLAAIEQDKNLQQLIVDGLVTPMKPKPRVSRRQKRRLRALKRQHGPSQVKA